MTVSPVRIPRSGASRVRLLLATALVLAVAGTGGMPAAADPTPSPTGTTSGLQLRIDLSRIRPYAPQPGDTLTIDGVLRNSSTADVSGISLRLLVSPSPVGERDTFDAYAAVNDGAPPPDATTATTAQIELADPQLNGGAEEPFKIDVPVDDLPLSTPWRVYEMAIVATGTTPVVPTGTPTTVGQARTFLPWAPVDVTGGSPLHVAWIWPLVDQPHRAPDGSWTDDDLAAELAPGGRLDDLLRAGAAAQDQHRPPVKRPNHRGKHGNRKPPPPPPAPPTPLRPVPMTWAVDPMLIDDASAMAAGYEIGSGDSAHPGAGQSAARSWLAALKTALPNGTLLSLPYADPDVTAEVRSGLAQQEQEAATQGRSVLSRVLGESGLGYSWPPGGFADQATLDTLSAFGIKTFVLDSSAMPAPAGLSYTATARVTAPTRDGPVDVLRSDSALTAALNDGAPALGSAAPTTSGAGSAALTTQRVLSELLMMQSQLPGPPVRDIVLAPDRRWAPSYRLAAGLAAGTGRVPWIKPVSLADVAADRRDVNEPGPLAFPPSARDQLLSHDHVDGVRAAGSRIDDLNAILTVPDDPLLRQLDDAELRALSSAWRAPWLAAEAATARTELATQANAAVAKVHLPYRPGESPTVTLTSHSGTVPITVTNDLDSDVRVLVEAKSVSQLVSISRPVTQTIEAHRSVAVDLHATAEGSGKFQLSVQLYTPRKGPPPHHQALSDQPVTLYLRSTAYGVTALLITGGATAVLFVAVIIRLIRRGRGARRRAVSA